MEDFPGGMQGAWVRSLVGELRLHVLCGTAKKYIHIKKKVGIWIKQDYKNVDDC